MKKTSKTIKLFMLSLAIISGCAVETNINSIIDKKENVFYKDGDFTFSTKDLSQNYVETKLRKLNSANNGSALVRFLDFARDKNTSAGNIPVLMRNIFQSDIVLKNSVKNNLSIITKRNESPAFDILAQFVFADILPNPTPTATPTPPTTGFRVNTYTKGNQKQSSTAMDRNGNFVVTWTSDGPDGDRNGIYGQRYNSSGIAQGTEFQVNTYTTNNQTDSSTAMDSNGNFVVTWQSNAQDGSGYGIYGQRYNSSGIAQGIEFQVSTYTAGSQVESSTAMDSNGNFVVTWSSITANNNYEVSVQRYNFNGVPQGSEFRANTYTNINQYNSSIAMDTNGNFVVIWTSSLQDGSQYGIYGQRYNSAGIAQGSEFKVNTYTTNNQTDPSTAMDSNGNFVVTWISLLQDGSQSGIYGQRYNFNGVPQGSEFQVNTYTTSNQIDPSTAMDSNGNFVVTWISLSQDGSQYGIYGQRYNSAGIGQGSEFQVNTYTTSNQIDPSTSMDSNGNFVVTWTSNSQNGIGGGDGIYGQRYDSNGMPR